MKQFSSWYPLTAEGVEEHAPSEAAAIQVKRTEGLVDYESGKSAMVSYFYADDPCEALRERFADEIDSPGARGFGPLAFRILRDDDAKDALAELLFKFVQNFGEPPEFNRYPEESS